MMKMRLNHSVLTELRNGRSVMLFRKRFMAVWVLAVAIGSMGSAAQKIYWNGGGPESGHSWVKRANTDGTSVETVLDGQYNNGFRGIAFDIAGGYLYGGDGSPSMFRASSDGTGRENLSVSHHVTDVEVDAVNGKVYWSSATQSSSDRRILRANLDGTNVQTLATIPYLDICMGLALDVPANKLYYSYDRYSNHHGEIRVANTDGTDNSLLIDLGYVAGPVDVEIDVTSGKLYWRESGSSQVNERLRRANIDGSAVEDLFVGPTRLWAYDAIHFDQLNGKFYYAYPNSIEGRLVDIFRSNPDGSDSELVLTTDAGQVTYMETASIPQPAIFAFYNNSAWDGGDGAANAADDDAIASDKVVAVARPDRHFRQLHELRQGHQRTDDRRA